MIERIITDSNGRKHITNEPQLHPPQRTAAVGEDTKTWVGLTDEERGALTSGMVKGWVVEQLAIAIEAKLKEKNT